MTYLAIEQEDTVRATAAVVAAIAPSDGAARPLCASLQAQAEAVVAAAVLGTRWGEIVDSLAADGATIDRLELALDRLVAVTASTDDAASARTVAEMACLVALAAAVPDEALRSLDDAEALIARVADRFARVEDAIADVDDGAHWRALANLQAAVASYLSTATTALPRRRSVALAAPEPALTVAQRLYQDAARGDELATENAVIHPAFMPLALTALTS